MFEKNPICLKKGPFVVLSEGLSSPYVEKAPYVANQVPICDPYAAHMWPICFSSSSDAVLPGSSPVQFLHSLTYSKLITV